MKSLQLFKFTVAPILPQIAPVGLTLNKGFGKVIFGISIKYESVVLKFGVPLSVAVTVIRCEPTKPAFAVTKKTALPLALLTVDNAEPKVAHEALIVTVWFASGPLKDTGINNESEFEQKSNVSTPHA